MAGKRYSLSYAFFYPIVHLAVRAFYRKVIIEGSELRAPKDKRVILVSNHQNGMMDPLMLCAFHHRQLHFLTRADVFRKPLANAIFRGFNMMPVYRDRDKIGDLKSKNDAVFAECVRRINAGNTVALFPEGTHGNRKHLRAFKKGTARLAFQAMELGRSEMAELVIQPVGLDYTDYTDTRSVLRIRYAPPIQVLPFHANSSVDMPRALVRLTAEISAGLRSALVHYEPADIYPTGRVLWQITAADNDLKDEREFAQDFNSFWSNQSEEARELVRNKAGEYRLLRKKLNVQESALSLRRQPAKGFKIFAIIPLWVVWQLASRLPNVFIARFVSVKVKDPHFVSSAKLVLGIFIYPVWWVLLTLMVCPIVPALWFLAIPFILVLSAILGPNAADSLAQHRAFQRLKSLSLHEDLQRLIVLRTELSKVFTQQNRKV